MTTPLSFTQGHSLRYPGPDVARGFMLLLIALANVTYWASAVGTQVYDSHVDSILALIRVAFIDQRAYPLFAVLFGFGLMTMVKRRRQSFVSNAIQGLEAQGYTVAPLEQGHSIGTLFQRDSMITARRLLRRRGWWMIVIGLVHSLLFPGDVIGAYAIIALLLAGLFARENARALLILGSVWGLFSLVQVAVVALVDPSVMTGGLPLSFVDYSPFGLLTNVGLWLLVSVSSVVSSMSVFGVCLGGYLATTSLISQPERHRGSLEVIAALGLLIAFLGSLPFGLVEAEMLNVHLSWWMLPLNHFAGICGALGWLALLVVYAGPVPMLGRLTGMRWALASVGRRSMSSYILQSVLFAAIFLPLYGRGMRFSELATVLISVGVWGLSVALAMVFEAFGKQGPLERLLRFLVTRSGRRELPALPPAVVASLPQMSVGQQGVSPVSSVGIPFPPLAASFPAVETANQRVGTGEDQGLPFRMS